MATIKIPTGTTGTPGSRPPAPGVPTKPTSIDLICHGSIEWPADLGAPTVRSINDAFDVQHWRYQEKLDQLTRAWVEIPSPVDVKVDLQAPVRDGAVMRVAFLISPVALPKQSVRVALKPVRWLRPDGQDTGKLDVEPPELFFDAGARRLPAIRVRLA